MTYTRIQSSIIIYFIIIDLIWINFSSLTFFYSKKFISIQIFLSFILYGVYKFYKKYRSFPEIISLLQSSFFFFSFCPVMLVFSYLVNTQGYPYIDSTLASVDHYFGIYTPSIVLWFRNHQVWYFVFSLIYYGYLLQFIFIIVYFSLRNEAQHLQRFILQFMIASFLTVLMSGFFPAEGPYVWYPYPPDDYSRSALNCLHELRQGILNINQGEGIVCLPSLHTIMSILFPYCFRNQRNIIFIPVLILNILMLFSCLPIGQHYFADLLGSLPIALVVIGIEKLIFKYVRPAS